MFGTDNATVNYATTYQNALALKYNEMGHFYSRKLWNSPGNNELKWDGSKTVMVPRLLIKEGRVDSVRRQLGFPNANYENQWIPYVLKNEREWGTLVNPKDVLETKEIVSIGNITRTYNNTQKFPEMDKQMFSSLYNLKSELDNGEGIKELTLNETNILLEFDRMMTEMSEGEVPEEGRELYITPTVSTILKNAQGLSRNIDVQNNNGVIARAVKRLDTVELLEVPSTRFKTLYDFTEGAKDDPAAQQIQMMLIHTPCMAAPQRYEFVGLTPPNAMTKGQWLYYENSYDDVILFETKTPGIQFIVDGGAN